MRTTMSKSQISSIKVEVPKETLSNFESLATERNENLNCLLSTALEEYINNLDPLLPPVETIISKLPEVKTQLNELGIVHMSLVGAIGMEESQRGKKIEFLVENVGGSALGWSRSAKVKKIINLELDCQCDIELVSKSIFSSVELESILAEAREIF